MKLCAVSLACQSIPSRHVRQFQASSEHVKLPTAIKSPAKRAPHAWREMIGCIAPLSVKESNYSVHFTLGFDVYRIDNIVDSYPYIFLSIVVTEKRKATQTHH